MCLNWCARIYTFNRSLYYLATQISTVLDILMVRQFWKFLASLALILRKLVKLMVHFCKRKVEGGNSSSPPLFFLTQKRSSVFSYAFLELSEMIKELTSFGPTETWVWILAVWPWPTSLCLIRIIKAYTLEWGFPGGNNGKDLPANAGDIRYLGSIPGTERSPGEGNGNPLQYFCLENPMDKRSLEGYSP